MLSLSRRYKGWQPDVKIYLEGEHEQYKLVLEANDGTGLTVDKRELYKAPVTGYQSKVSLPFKGYEGGAGLNTRIYLEGRGGLFYTRMHIKAGFVHFEDSKERFADLVIDYSTNPHGNGNFEESPELAKQYYRDVRSSKRDPYGYDAKAKGLSLEEVRALVGK